MTTKKIKNTSMKKIKKSVKKDKSTKVLEEDTVEVKTTRKPLKITLAIWNTLGEFISKDTLKYALNGVYFDEDCIVAIDGRRMMKVSNVKVPKFLIGKIIKHKKVSLVDGVNKVTNITFRRNGKDKIEIHDGQGTIHLSTIIEGKFPNYEMFIPKSEEVVEVPRMKFNFNLLPKNWGGTLNFYGELKPIMVDKLFFTFIDKDDGQECVEYTDDVIFIIMPMKQD